MIYFIANDGSIGCALELPANALELDEETYLLISENRDMLDITVEGTALRVTPNLTKYKSGVERKLDTLLSTKKPDFGELNELHLLLTYRGAATLFVRGIALSRDEAATHMKKTIDEWQIACAEHNRLHNLLALAKDFSEVDDVLAEIGG